MNCSMDLDGRKNGLISRYEREASRGDVDERESPTPGRAFAAVMEVISGLNVIESLQVILAFTATAEFSFEADVPSSFVTCLIRLIQGFANDIPAAGLSVCVICNMWREYDDDFPVLGDPELVQIVFELSVSAAPEMLRCDAFKALFSLCKTNIKAMREPFYNGSFIERVVGILMGDADVTCVYGLVHLLMKMASDEAPPPWDVMKLAIPVLQRYALAECDQKVASIATKALCNLLNDVKTFGLVRPTDQARVIADDVVVRAQRATELSMKMNCYMLLRKLKIFDDRRIYEMMANDVREYMEIPADDLYVYLIQCLVTEPLHVLNSGVLRIVVSEQSNMCFKNRQYVGLLLTEILGDRSFHIGYPEFFEEMLSEGIVDMVCDVICVDVDPEIAAKVIESLGQFVFARPEYAKTIRESGFVDTVMSICEETGNMDLGEGARVFLMSHTLDE